MEGNVQVAGKRLAIIRQALLILVATDGEDDGRALHPEARRGYGRVLQVAAEAGLLSEPERVLLLGVASGWNRQPTVVRELLAYFVSEVLEASRGPGLAAVVEWLRSQPRAQ